MVCLSAWPKVALPLDPREVVEFRQLISRLCLGVHPIFYTIVVPRGVVSDPSEHPRVAVLAIILHRRGGISFTEGRGAKRDRTIAPAIEHRGRIDYPPCLPARSETRVKQLVGCRSRPQEWFRTLRGAVGTRLVTLPRFDLLLGEKYVDP